jgi:hypothetical protein
VDPHRSYSEEPEPRWTGGEQYGESNWDNRYDGFRVPEPRVVGNDRYTTSETRYGESGYGEPAYGEPGYGEPGLGSPNRPVGPRSGEPLPPLPDASGRAAHGAPPRGAAAMGGATVAGPAVSGAPMPGAPMPGAPMPGAPMSGGPMSTGAMQTGPMSGGAMPAGPISGVPAGGQLPGVLAGGGPGMGGDPGEAYPRFRTEAIDRNALRRPGAPGPAPVSDGIYRARRPAIALLLGLVAAVTALPVVRVLIAGLDSPVAAGAVFASLLVLLGLPLGVMGMYGLMTGAARVPDAPPSYAWLRPPLSYLVVALVLLLAAGLAAS